MSDNSANKATVLLVDDDASTNFLHRRAIKKANIDVNVLEALNGGDALDTLRALHARGLQAPQIIFLDINMPGLNGWEFLEHYTKLPKDWLQHTKIYMLTTSLNPDDQERATQFDHVSGFLDKMLSTDRFIKIMTT